MRLAQLLLILSLVTLAAPAISQETTGTTEAVKVSVVLVEVLAVDDQGRTVADLEQSDFQLSIAGQITGIDSLDIHCPRGEFADPAPIDKLSERKPPVDDPRRIVLAVDYHHLNQRDRARVIDEVREMVRRLKTPTEEVMVVAVTDDLRIEQRFTADATELEESLERMKYDASLFASGLQGGNTNWSVSSSAKPESYLSAMATLMDVLAEYDQAKAVVLFSALLSRGDQLEEWFHDVAERAASARTAFYPAQTRWMQNPTSKHGTHRQEGTAGGGRILPRLAAESGGRMPPTTADLSLAYAWAQRDLTCRYTVSYTIDETKALASQDVQLVVARPGVKLSYPDRIRLWTEQERRQSRLRAAFADPEQFEHPLVRTLVYPLRPGTAKKTWDTVTAIHFPMPVDADGATLELRATLLRGNRLTDEIFREIHVPGKPGQDTRNVTLVGDTPLKSGSYSLTVALSSPDVEGLVTTRASIEVPDVPRGGTFVRGPILARVVTDGTLIRADQEERPDTALDRMLSEDETFEPLVVQEIGTGDVLLLGWQVCSDGKSLSSGTMIDRRVVSGDGTEVSGLSSVQLALQGEAKIRCHGDLDRIEGGSLPAGEYDVEIVVRSGGNVIASERTPLLVE